MTVDVDIKIALALLLEGNVACYITTPMAVKRKRKVMHSNMIGSNVSMLAMMVVYHGAGAGGGKESRPGISSYYMLDVVEKSDSEFEESSEIQSESG